MKSFVLLALLGCAAATKLQPQDCGCPAVVVPVSPCGCEEASGIKVGVQNAVLAGQERAGAFAKLTSESAGSQTQIGAQNIVIPDKHTVTD